ncbi:MAG TPA: GerMN domain-containing protein [Candidatus Cottocaccamicrobium excrementipullorum]|nr:GerMN domain-containing protein [Candidatus Cottocaccamicrobium excrementipullorum]
MKNRNLIRLCLVLLGALLFAGCQRKETPVSNPEENQYIIYYLNSGMTRLEPVEYTAQSEDSLDLIQELYEQIRTVPSDLDATSPLSSKVELQRMQWDQNVLYLYFDANYTLMSSSQEILCRAALTKTMTQIPGVEYINLYSGEQPLMDASGNPVGMLSAGDFMDNISDVNAFEKSELTLYFADASGQALQPETREVIHSINTSMERLVIEQLLEGPETEGLKSTIPGDTKLLNISVTDNVCYLNFDGTFLNNTLEVGDEIAIYSIVDSLTQLTTVNRVQFSVNGSAAVMFRDRISLDTLFEQNMDYVTGGDEH